MKWLEKKTKKGILKYRFPNIAEGYEFLGYIDSVDTASGIYKTRAKFIIAMKDLVDFSSVGYSSYDEFLNDKDNMFVPAGEIANEILNDIAMVFEKKN